MTQTSTSPAGEVGEPSEPGGFVGDIFFGHPEYSTMGTHRWDGDKWERLRSEVEVLCDLLAAARNERDNLLERLSATDTEAMRLGAAIVQAREALEAEYERARLGPSTPGLAICGAINRIRAALDRKG